MIRRGQPRRTHTHPARLWAQRHGHTTTATLDRLPRTHLDGWADAGCPSPHRPHGRNPLRERASDARRMDTLELAGTRDPWPQRCHRCTDTSPKALDTWAATIVHADAHHLPAAVPAHVARALWRTRPHLRAHLDRLAETTDPAHPGCPGWLTDPVCEGQCRT